MKAISGGIGLAALLVAFGIGALSIGSPAQAADPALDQSGNLCLQGYLIGHTDIPDDSTILFVMKDGTMWKNTLQYPCFGLKFQHTFKYATPTDQICANKQTIRVLTQGQIRIAHGGLVGLVPLNPNRPEPEGISCELGNFTRYQPAN
jgi:hypothetical protein